MITSGAMYSTVPVFSLSFVSFSNLTEMPKSISLTGELMLSCSKRMLSLLMSRCTIPLMWQYSTELITCFISFDAIFSLKFSAFWIIEKMSPPSQNLVSYAYSVMR